MFGKILGLASIGEFLMGISLTKKFVEGILVIAALAGIAAIVAGSIVIFALYVLDVLLLARGVGFGVAALITILAGLSVVLLSAAAILYRLKMMKTVPFTVSGAELAGTSALAALKGFYKGFSEKHRH